MFGWNFMAIFLVTVPSFYDLVRYDKWNESWCARNHGHFGAHFISIQFRPIHMENQPFRCETQCQMHHGQVQGMTN